MSDLRAYLHEAWWRCRLTDTQTIRLSEWRCRWFPYRLTDYNGPEQPLGPTRWQWPDVLGRPIR